MAIASIRRSLPHSQLLSADFASDP